MIWAVYYHRTLNIGKIFYFFLYTSAANLQVRSTSVVIKYFYTCKQKNYIMQRLGTSRAVTCARTAFQHPISGQKAVGADACKASTCRRRRQWARSLRGYNPGSLYTDIPGGLRFLSVTAQGIQSKETENGTPGWFRFYSNFNICICNLDFRAWNFHL